MLCGFHGVEDLLAERSPEVPFETIRRWVLALDPAARRRRPKPSPRSRVDGMAARIAGKRMHLWRAVDDVGEMLDVLVQRRRNRAATHKLLEKRGLGFRCNDCRELRRAAADNKSAHLPRSTSSSGRPPPVPPADARAS